MTQTQQIQFAQDSITSISVLIRSTSNKSLASDLISVIDAYRQAIREIVRP